MSMRMRDLIKLVRQAKTAQEEREVIAKECAAIRTSFKNEESELRPRNVAKLLYIHMMGYPTHFGQMECLKLIVSPHYSDKRIGYLALMLLLDERQEVLMLVTNSLKQDLAHANQYVVGLALCALGNISSDSMARDCAPEVEKLLNNSNAYVRKKAAICTIRILRKVPDLMENFVPRVQGLIKEKEHGVLLTGVALMTEMCHVDSTIVQQFRTLVPQLVKVLKSIVQYGYSPEYDVGGITDPFLQVKILRLLRVLGQGDQESSDLMNDLLAQIATNTDALKNVGNAILYECVNTIMTIDSDKDLRVLAINILGRFLANRDNNIRYVALNTLCKVVNIDTDAVQRHRNTVVDCLKDNDISIRRRALELIYSLVNDSNVRVLVRELINFLLVADVEFRPDLTAKLCSVAEKYAPSARWRVDTILKVMSIAGQYVTDEISSNLISLIANTPDLHAYAVQKMYLALTEDISQQSLVQVAVWTIGEFGDLLVTSSQISGEDTPLRVTEDDVLLLLTKILRTPATKSSTKRFILTALLKLSTRLPSHAQQRIRELIDEYLRHLNVELQQRSVEFDKILQLDSIRGSLLARMPVPDPKIPVAPEKSVSTNGAATSSPTATLLDPLAALGLGTSASSGTSAPYLDSSVDLLSLDFSSTPSQPVGGAPVAQPIDLMSQLFGSSNGTSTPPPAAPTGIAPVLSPSTTLTPSIATNGSNALSGFGQQFPTMTVLEAPEDGLTVTFDISKPQPQNPQFTLIIATFTNKSATSLTDFEMKTAVPTYLKLALMPASSTLIPPNNSVKVTQQVKIANSLHGEKPLRLRLKFEYKVSGTPRSKEAQIDTFPSGV